MDFPIFLEMSCRHMLKNILRYSSLSALLLLAMNAVVAAPKPILEELVKEHRTLGGSLVRYPEGTPEMRFYKVTIPQGAKIPLHTHPSPVIVYVQKGKLTNIRIVSGEEVTDIIKPGSGFLEGSPDEPHYLVNNGQEPVILFVTFASTKGLPNLIKSVNMDL